MNHKEFISQLEPQKRRVLTEQNNHNAAIHLTVHWGLILLFGIYIALKLPFWMVLIIPQGILLSFCFTILHETIHDTAFKNNMLNKVIGRICSVLIILPLEWFRYFHFAHHRHTNDPKNDPELNMPKPETLSQYLWYTSGIPVWRGNIGKLVKNALGHNHDPYVPTKGNEKVRTEARVMLIIYAYIFIALSVGQTWIFWCWALPLILGQPFLRLYLLAEHGRCATVTNMFENTRTTFTNRLVYFIAWNMPYHTEHHTMPQVPYHKLPELHQHIKTELQVTADGYTEFHMDYVDGFHNI